MTRISIGLPVYNGEECLERAITSILDQTYFDFELIISDNASVDQTWAICEKYSRKDNRIRIVRQKFNVGAMGNFTSVAAIAKSEFFIWAAHDDYWDRNRLLNLYNSVANRPGVAAFGVLRCVMRNGGEARHLAHNCAFSYDYKWNFLRRLVYYIVPENLGKANVIYALWPHADIVRCLPSLRDASFGDCFFVHELLIGCAVIDSHEAVMYKQLSDKEAQRPSAIGVATAILLPLRAAVTCFVISFGYIKMISRFEKILYFFLLIVKVPLFVISTIISRQNNREYFLTKGAA